MAYKQDGVVRVFEVEVLGWNGWGRVEGGADSAKNHDVILVRHAPRTPTLALGFEHISCQSGPWTPQSPP